MENNLSTEKEYSQYRLAKFCEKGTLLEYRGQPVFIIGSGVKFRDDFISRLIEAYSQSAINRTA
jgi:hypothetical protein